jgi:hypothetical protein
MSLLAETSITLAQASHRLPTRPALSTLWRWRTKGVRGVKLETALVGGRRVTSIEALERFVAAIALTETGSAVVIPAKEGEQQIRAAEAELDRFGI